VNSRSLFIITHILDPIHLSISSSLIQNEIRINQWSSIPKGKICEVMTKQEHIEMSRFHNLLTQLRFQQTRNKDKI
jgi:hypothetical protein